MGSDPVYDLIEAVAEKVICHGTALKNSQKTGSIEYLFESSDHLGSPQITSVHAGFRGIAGQSKKAPKASKATTGAPGKKAG